MKYLALITLVFLMSACVGTGTENTGLVTLSDNWQIQSSAKAGMDGKTISGTGLSVKEWYNAKVPSTVMGVLTENGLYQDLLTGTNYKDADRTPFDTSWWYRTTFSLSGLKNKQVGLLFDGISYRANIWLNGKQIATKEEVYGTFRRFSFDITDLVKEENTLAVEVFRAQTGEPNMGFVDWNPRPLDENMGIFREVFVKITGDVDLKNTRVRSNLNTGSLQEALLTIETEVSNLSEKAVKGELKGEIENIRFSIPISLEPNEKKIVSVGPDDVKELKIKNPRIWWSWDLGTPELYHLNLKFVTGNQILSEDEVTFGIRKIETYFTEAGHRGYMLNGKKVLIKGAGWTDDIFLRDTPESNEMQVRYVKDMNLNTIRFENIWGTSRHIYEMCDKYGILALVGWSCQWEWEGYLGTPDDDFGCIRSEEDMNLLTQYFNDQVVWLRNHPSIIAWYGGSDKLLRPELEKRYMALLPEIDDRPYIGSAKAQVSEITGPTGMKMYGPYEYVGPNYWFIDKKLGGAYGFNTETGPGAQLPVYESILKMIPEDQLWPLNDTWDFHCTTSTTALNNLNVMTEVVNAKYGHATDLQDYLRKAHLVSYESTKSMFEAFRVNKPETTGLIHWMLNSAWPSLYWQLYDYYGIPTPDYYGVKRANTPCQLIYNYGDNSIYAVNETLSDISKLKAEIKIYSLDSKLLSDKTTDISIASDTSSKIVELDNKEKNTFVFLRLLDNKGKQIAENFYVLSSKQDSYDWEQSSWVGTPMNGYADFKDLAAIPEAEIGINVVETTEGSKRFIGVEIDNKSQVIAFFVDFKVKNKKGELLFPVFWNDNYVSLLPGSTRTIKCEMESNVDMDGLSVVMKGWNVKEQEIRIK
jgi:exo-1,4-beta-D-glucosaminidase